MEAPTGKDMVDAMARGIESTVKEHLRDELVGKLVAEFKLEITDIVDKQLAEIVFNAYSNHNHREMRNELAVLMKWTKGEVERTKEYTMESRVIEP